MALAKLGLLHLIPELYGQVLIPATVYDEVVLRGIAAGGVIADPYRCGAISARGRDESFETILNRDDIWIDESLVRRVWVELREDQ